MRDAADGGGLSMGPGAEFDLVRDFVARWGARARGIGGDCALLDVPAGERLVVSTDTSVEDVHFRDAWLEPAEIGWRAATGALSDLAAAAARPLGVLVALTLPASWRARAGALADGLAEAVDAVGAPIVGGDTTAGERLSLTVTVLGAAARPLTRGGALPGDALWVTGRFGGPGAAVAAWRAGREPAAADRARFARPSARIAEARWLAEQGARAAVDVSDGLAADLRHLAAASGVRLVLDAERVPRMSGVEVREALASGEEYELAVAAPPGLDADAFARRFGVPLTMIGQVESGASEVVACVDLPAGYDHLSR
jgi:thiamine-monophosphate kinase